MSILHQEPGIEMAQPPPVTITTIPVYHQPQLIMPQMPQTMKSCGLIGFGITLFILSVISTGLSGWATSLSVRPYYAYASLGCSIFFLLTSLLSCYGGNDVGNRKCCIITALIFGILGVIVGFVGIVSSVIALLFFKDCKVCSVDLSIGNLGVNCSADCVEAYFPLYIGLAVLTLFEAIMGLILSCGACCNVCSCCCCYKEAQNGFIVQSAPVSTFVQTVHGGGPPPYKRLEENEYPDMYRQAPYNVNC